MILATVLTLSLLLTACNSGDTPADDTNTPGMSDTATQGNTPAAGGDFEYHNDAALGGVVITKYIGKSDTAQVPETIGGKPVVKVEDSAFQVVMSLRTSFIPDSVTKLGVRAFAGCASLESITIGNGVTEIPDAPTDTHYADTHAYRLTR